LGNPGAEYDATRHNIGFDVVDDLAARSQLSLKRHRRAMALVGQGRVAGLSAVLAKPLTFMNNSGSAVAGLASYYGAEIDKIVVIHDDLDLPLGGLRLKRGGGDGGHNGLKSIRSSLSTGDFLRIRVGIGRPPGRMDPAAYVLRRFAPAEREEVRLTVSDAADAVECLLTEGLSPAQNRFNR
jgi:PTH1 family peptidyl-tRNA hydrolase